MKKYLIGLLLVALAFQASAVVIQGQAADGSYKNYAVDSTGAFVTGAGTGGTGAATGTGAGSPVSYSTLISTVNSSVTPLGISGVFTGTSEEVVNFAEVRVSIWASHASATDGLQMQQSNDGTNWDNVDTYSVPATTGKAFGSGIGARYFRVIYTNGATAQTGFRMQTTYHYVRTKPSAARPQDGRTNDNDFEEVLAYNMGYDPVTNSWNRLQISGGATVFKPYAIATNDWSYAAIAGGIVNTTDVVVKAAAGAGIRNYVSAISCTNAAAAVATEMVLKDGATVIWRGYLGLVAQAAGELNVTFPNPLKSTANTALNLAAITTAAQVYCNLQGYTAP